MYSSYFQTAKINTELFLLHVKLFFTKLINNGRSNESQLSTKLVNESTEVTVVSFLDQNHPKMKSSNELRKHQKMLLNKEWTIKDWQFLIDNFTEKEIIRDFFEGDIYAYQIYKKDAANMDKMKKHVKNGLDPHHLTEQDLVGFYSTSEQKESTVTDHYLTADLTQDKLGERGLDYKIDKILMNQFHGFEFTPEGLQAFAQEHGHFITLRNAQAHAEKVNKMLRRTRMMDPRKTGVVDMENETTHEIKKFCKKENIPPEVANALVLRGKKIVSLMNSNIGRNIGQSVTAQNKSGMIKNFVRAIANGADFLGIELNDVGSQLIKMSEEDKVVKN